VGIRGPPWKLDTRYEVPDAFAAAVWKAGGAERIAVAARRYEHNQCVPFEQLQVTGPRQRRLLDPLKLGRGVAGVMDLAADDRSNLYLVAEVNQLYKFDPSGRPATAPCPAGPESERRALEGRVPGHRRAPGDHGVAGLFQKPPLASARPARTTGSRHGSTGSWP
jgi:hypothetical protein